MSNKAPMVFTHNHFSKIYWGIGVVALLFGLVSVRGGGIFFVMVLGLAFAFLAIKAVSHQVIVQNNRLISKDVFSEKSILITPHSRIYTLKSLESINIIIRRYNYWIHVVNPTDSLKFNANVNDADALYHQVATLEQEIIAPKWLETFQQNRELKFDNDWRLTEEALFFKGKAYKFFDLEGMKLVNGQFSLLKAGKLWNVAVLTQPVSNIPNFHLFYTMVKAVSGFQ